MAKIIPLCLAEPLQGLVQRQPCFPLQNLSFKRGPWSVLSCGRVITSKTAASRFPRGGCRVERERVSCMAQVSDEVNPTPGPPSARWFALPSSVLGGRGSPRTVGRWVPQCRGGGLPSPGLPHPLPAHPALTADGVTKGAFLLESGGLCETSEIREGAWAWGEAAGVCCTCDSRVAWGSPRPTPSPHSAQCPLPAQAAQCAGLAFLVTFLCQTVGVPGPLPSTAPRLPCSPWPPQSTHCQALGLTG